MTYDLIDDIWLLAATVAELQCENAKLRGRIEVLQTAAFTTSEAHANESRALGYRLQMIEAAVADLAREGRHPDADALLRQRLGVDKAGRVVSLRGVA